MNKLIQTLLAGLLAIAPVTAKVNSGKTYMSTRDTLNYSSLFKAVSPRVTTSKNSFGADISANAFWKQSHNNTAMAKYFGAGTPASTTEIVDGTIQVAKSLATTTQSLFSWQIEHDETDNAPNHATAASEKGMSGRVTLDPSHREYGVTLAWAQNLDAVIEGLSFNAKTAVVNVQTNMKAGVKDEVKSTAATKGLNGKGLLDYFTGSASNAVQKALANQKINTTALSETGVANVELSMGYNFINENDSCVSGSIDAVIPTGNTAKGVNMFEPIIGKGGDHWALGLGLQGKFSVWKSEDKKHAINFAADAAYKYYFDAKQTRTLGFAATSDDNAWISGAQYVLVVKKGDNSTLLPFANIATLPMHVTPGSHFELNAGFNGMHDGFCWDLGYNLFYKEAEAAKLVTEWTNDTYGHPLDTFVVGTTAADLTIANKVSSVIQDASGAATAITGAGSTFYINIDAAKTPSQLTHSVVGSVGYVFNNLNTPIRVGIGGFGEFSGEDNDALETWAVFGKVGINF